MEDGESADNPLVPGLVDRVRAIPTSRPRLWVADRGFSDYTTPPRLAESGDSYVIRLKGSNKLQEDAKVPARTGVDSEGRPITGRWGTLAKDHPFRVRVITVTRKDQDSLIIATNLLDAGQYPADDLLTLYRGRWGIETMFQQVVQTFDLRHLIGGTPQATVFQATICFLLYNATLMVRDVVAEQAQQSAKDVSLQLLFEDLVGELKGWFLMLNLGQTMRVLEATPDGEPEQILEHLRRILKRRWTKR